MRIAIVGTELCAVDGRGGGLEQVLRRWATSLAADHAVVVVSHRVGRPAAGDTDAFERIEVAGTTELGPTLQRLRPDVVSLHNRPRWAGRCPPESAVAVTFHNYPSAWKAGRRPGVPSRPVSFSAVSCALAAAASDRLHVARGAVTVTPPSIDPAYLRAGSRRPHPVVLAPNRLLRKKGVEDLLAVARDPRLRDVMFSFADVISPWVRPTAEHRELREAVRTVPNAALFPAARSADELVERYLACGVVACPVREPEGLGLVALEAQACGAPLVTTDLGGLREATFAPNRCLPPGDHEALVQGVLDGLARPGAAGDGPRLLVQSRHSPEASASAFGAFLLGARRV